MKNKFITLVICLITFCHYTFGQSEQGKFSVGLRAGVNFQNLNGKDEGGNTLKNKLAVRYHLGLISEIAIAPDFYFQPGILFSTKGAKWNGPENASVSLYYLELPLHLLYKPLLGTGRLLLGFGPYLAYAVGGKVKYNGNSSNITFKGTASEDEDIAVFKPFDAGADLLFGYEFANKISIQLNAQLGLLKINPSYQDDPDNKVSIKNTGFGLSMGYRF